MDVLRYVAFSDRPDGGNPAGVVLDASGLSEERMLEIAAEVGYSETAFVIGIVALRCQGHSSHWLSLPWMVASAEEPSRPNSLTVPFVVTQDCGLPEVTDSPPTPPPRAERCVVFWV